MPAFLNFPLSTLTIGVLSLKVIVIIFIRKQYNKKINFFDKTEKKTIEKTYTQKKVFPFLFLKNDDKFRFIFLYQDNRFIKLKAVYEDGKFKFFSFIWNKLLSNNATVFDSNFFGAFRKDTIGRQSALIET